MKERKKGRKKECCKQLKKETNTAIIKWGEKQRKLYTLLARRKIKAENLK